MRIRNIEQLKIQQKKVLIRVDFNVPIRSLRVADDARIRAALPTIRYALEREARVVLASHLGRPKGVPDSSLSLRPVEERLCELLGRPVFLLSRCAGPEVEEQVGQLGNGQVLMLQNMRFEEGEEKNDPAFARSLANLADVYVNDAFGCSHRTHASIAGVTRHFASRGIGFLMDKEIEALSRVRENPERPFLVILGGAKVSDKLGLIRNLLATADTIMVAGAMAYTLLKAKGVAVGSSPVETDRLEEIGRLLREADERKVEILLPQDHVIAAELKEDARVATTRGAEIPEDKVGGDIGPGTIDFFSRAIERARTIFWNGPMGVFEIDAFSAGTRAVAGAMSEARGFTVVGGGDTVAAIGRSSLQDRLSHISTGGGASLEFLEKGDLPGLAALRET